MSMSRPDRDKALLKYSVIQFVGVQETRRQYVADPVVIALNEAGVKHFYADFLSLSGADIMEL